MADFKVPRAAQVARDTKETSINIILNVDGGQLEGVPAITGERTNKHAFQSSPSQYVDIDTGIGFLDHMLHALAKHAGWSLYVKTKGDLISKQSDAEQNAARLPSYCS